MEKKPNTQTASSNAPWRNRITRYGEEPPDQLLAHEKNWRIHPLGQQEAIKGVLDQVGFVQNVIISERSGKCLDGHMRIQMAISEGQPTIPITYVDVSEEEEESLILAALDPVASIAVTDHDKFGELLGTLDNSNEALDLLLSSFLNDAERTSMKPAQPGNGSRNLGEPKAQIKLRPNLPRFTSNC